MTIGSARIEVRPELDERSLATLHDRLSAVVRDAVEHGLDAATKRPMSTYAAMTARARTDAAYRDGLLDAARVARAQGADASVPPCPSTMAAVYIEEIANGEQP